MHFCCIWPIRFQHLTLCFYSLCMCTETIILLLEELIAIIRCRQGCITISFFTLYFHTQIMNKDH